MFGEQNTRVLLKRADPVRDSAVPSRRLSAVDLIALAEAISEPAAHRRPRPTRRLVLTAGGMAVVIAGVAVIDRNLISTLDDPGATAGAVLVPIAYEIEDGPPSAANRLRALAGQVTDAPYDGHTGRYAYHRTKSWGDPLLHDESRRYVLGYANDTETWRLTDGSVRQRVTMLPPEFPDAKSRAYWSRNLPYRPGETQEQTTPPNPMEHWPANLPTDRAGLTELLQARHGTGDAAKALTAIYSQYVVPKQSRALALDILADMPGFAWRGRVTDRAGRTGVAITFQNNEKGGGKGGVSRQEGLLIFDARTGALLAHEIVLVESRDTRRVSTYLVVLDTGRTNQAG